MTASKHLTSTAKLSAALTSTNLAILDCSWYLPAQNRNALTEFESNHIPGARFFDIDRICDPISDLPHMLPSAELFSEAVGKLGIDNDSSVVVYDGTGIFSAARVWWMFHVFGHTHVRVLNGGFPKWQAEQRTVETGVQHVPTCQFSAVPTQGLVVTLDAVLENCDSQQAIVLDARPAARFDGTAPEPRPELPSGHMPGALSLPYDDLLTDGSLKSTDDLRAIFRAFGVDGCEPLITSCGSGVTAAIITLAMAEAGYGLQHLYDGAWAEWASVDHTPIVSA